MIRGITVFLFLFSTSVIARDLGQWKNTQPEIKQWYEHLMRPDVPTGSCCGEADAYWADEVHVRDGKVYAVITDDRPDGPLMRPHIDIGTEVEVPPEKVKWGPEDQDQTPQKNPTGHGVIFLSVAGYVWCYISPGGV